jgi:hypothetical protein
MVAATVRADVLPDRTAPAGAPGRALDVERL